MVLLAQHSSSRTGPADHGGHRTGGMASACARARASTLPRRRRALSDVVHRYRDQSLAVDRTLSLYPLGRPVGAEHPGIPAHRHLVPLADYFDVHGVVVLGLPRKGESRHWISLSTEK